ncbi:MAG: alpha/beta hydrolase [Firmicutes bacterium]|nr:alpha/beta hydrolase [Bacillota bacterium]
MERKEYKTRCGNIVYWTNTVLLSRRTLVFLPGLSANHTLFEKQIEYFSNTYNVLVWDAPAHAASRPFSLNFTLKDKAIWLHEILEKEGMVSPILIGQSMGGYVSQMYLELFKDASGFVSIDSAPLQKQYLKKWELLFLKHTEIMYRAFPWKLLLYYGSVGVSVTKFGQKQMRKMMEEYSNDPRYYCSLVGHGYRILAQAIELNLSYNIYCPCILICGKKDQAGFVKKYNKEWLKRTGLTMYWIDGAGHNSNSDQPEIVNSIIQTFVENT